MRMRYPSGGGPGETIGTRGGHLEARGGDAAARRGEVLSREDEAHDQEAPHDRHDVFGGRNGDVRNLGALTRRVRASRPPRVPGTGESRASFPAVSAYSRTVFGSAEKGARKFGCRR